MPRTCSHRVPCSRGYFGSAITPPLSPIGRTRARDGYEGFMRGQRVVIPGFASKMVTALPRLIPRSLMLFLGERNQLPPSDEEPGAQ